MWQGQRGSVAQKVETRVPLRTEFFRIFSIFSVFSMDHLLFCLFNLFMNVLTIVFSRRLLGNRTLLFLFHKDHAGLHSF